MKYVNQEGEFSIFFCLDFKLQEMPDTEKQGTE